jgi:hypothetical protein
LIADFLLIFLRSEDALIVSSAGGDQVVDDAGQFVGRSRDGLRGAQASPQAAKIRSQIGVTFMQRLCCQS